MESLLASLTNNNSKRTSTTNNDDEGLLSPEALLGMLQHYEQSGEAPPPELQQLMAALMQQAGDGREGPAQEAEEISPEAFFVAKTRVLTVHAEARDDTDKCLPGVELLERNCKLFVNVCGHARVAAPGDWSEGKIPEDVQRALESQEDAEGMRFPLSLSVPRADVDKRGDRCVVFDCVFNRDVVVAAMSAKKLKTFLVDITFSWVAHKYKVELDSDYALPKMKCKGGAPSKQQVRREKRSLIADVTDTSAAAAASAAPSNASFPLVAAAPKTEAAVNKLKSFTQPTSTSTSTSTNVSLSAATDASSPLPSSTATSSAAAKTSLPQAPFTMRMNGKPCTEVVVSVDLGGRSADALKKPMKVEVLREQLHISSLQSFADLRVELPLAVTAQGATALWNEGTHKLELHLPVQPLDQVLADAKKEAPHAVSELTFANEDLYELE